MASHPPEPVFSALMSEARSLNSKLFSLPRLELLSALETFGEDGALYRELKSSLRMEDGVLYANLEALKKMRYLKKNVERVEGKTLDSYAITNEGREALNRVRAWLKKWAEKTESG